MPRTISELNNVHPLDCPVVMQVRLAFADCTWFYDHGYIRYNDGTKAMLREHQHVALLAYGIPDGYHVHHIDGDRLNNRAVNLIVLSPTEHRAIHQPRRASVRMELVCPICQTSFPATAYRAHERNRRYCSDGCRNLANRVVTRPVASELARLIAEIGNWSALGRMFGVSDNAVRKWARGYQLI